MQPQASTSGTVIYFFRGQGCPHCEEEKAFLDRLMVFFPERQLANRLAGVIAVGGSRNGGQELTIRSVQVALMSQQMIVLPKRVEYFVPDAHYASYYALIKAAGAIVVICTQLTLGFLSDHAESRVGKRYWARPALSETSVEFHGEVGLRTWSWTRNPRWRAP